jgi:hypothetical protein
VAGQMDTHEKEKYWQTYLGKNNIHHASPLTQRFQSE